MSIVVILAGSPPFGEIDQSSVFWRS